MNLRPLSILFAAFALIAVGCNSGLGEVSRVVIVTFDTTRADRIGCYGYAEAHTPNLDRLAKESVLFEQAVSPVPTTLPSHCTMFTGLLPQDHGVRYNLMYRLDAEAETLAEVLKSEGFATAAVPASYILAEMFGLDQGFDLYVGPPGRKEADADNDHPGAVYRRAGDGVDEALEWLDRQGQDQSFLWLHFYDPHVPYDPPFPYSSEFRDRPYDGEIAYADAQFGRLLEALREDPSWNRTLLIVAGDHGEGLHEHGERWHSLLVYETTQRVPLIIRAPGASPSRVKEPVHLADLMPTVLDLVGVNQPGPLRGTSLRPALEGRATPPRELYFESLAGALNYGWLELTGIRDGRWKLIDSTSEPELYDLAEDPEELLNLAHLEPELVQELRTGLAEIAEPLTSQSLAADAHDAVLDPQTEAFLNSLGYVGGGAGGSRGEDAPHPRNLVDLEAEILSARRAIAQERWDLLEEMALYVLSRDPGNKWALNNIITALIATDRSHEAQDRAAEFVRLYPDRPQPYVALAKAYRAQDQAETAYEVLKQGLESVPGNEWLTYLALVAGFDANLEICAGEVDSAAAEFPTSPRVTLLVARCHALERDFDAALASVRHAVDQGFANMDMLEKAEDFEELVLLPGFDELREYAESRKQEGPPAS